MFGINRENVFVCIALYMFITQYNKWVCKINISDFKLFTTKHMPLKELNCCSCTSTDLLKLMCYDILSVLFFLTWSSKFVASKLHSAKYCKANSILCFPSLFVWVLFSHFSSLSMIGTSCLPLKDLQIILQLQTSSFCTILYHSRQPKIRHLL